MLPGFVFCPAAASACRLSLPAKNLEALIYGRQIRVLSGGSKRQSALPTGSKWLRAPPGEEFGKFNLCFPDSCGLRGSQWNRALPGGEFGDSNLWFPDSCGLRSSQWNRAPPGGESGGF